MNERITHTEETTSTSTSLIYRIQQKDHVSWCRFVDLYGPLIWSWCRSSGLQPSDADDCCQNVLMSISSAISRYQRSGSFRGWLWKITSNKIHDYFRSKQQSPNAVGGSDIGNWLNQVPADPPSDASTSAVVQSLRMRALELIRGEFGVATWAAFTGMVFENRSAQEIAEDLGWIEPGETVEKGARRVRQAKFRVVTRLREEFGDVLDI